jgi:hypothetical protein
MAQKLRFQRPLGERRYKKLFVVSVEGSKTEPQYFAIFNQPQSIVLVKCLKRPSTESSPIQVLKKMQGYLRKESLRKHDGTPAKMHKIGFLLVLESAFIKVGRHQVELIHIPSHPAPSHFQLHGHVHEKRPNKLVGRQLNLSVEVWDYKPVPEKTIIALLDLADPTLEPQSLTAF